MTMSLLVSFRARNARCNQSRDQDTRYRSASAAWRDARAWSSVSSSAWRRLQAWLRDAPELAPSRKCRGSCAISRGSLRSGSTAGACAESPRRQLAPPPREEAEAVRRAREIVPWPFPYAIAFSSAVLCSIVHDSKQLLSCPQAILARGLAVVGPLSATREWCIFAVGLRKTNPVYLAPRRGAGLHTTEGVCVRPWSARPADLCSRGAARGTAGGNRFGCARWRSPVRRHLLRRGLLLRADLRAATCSYPRLPIRLRARLSTGRETGMHDPQRTTVSHRDRSGLSVSLGQRMQVGQQVCLQAGIQAGRGGPRKCGRRRPAGRRCEVRKRRVRAFVPFAVPTTLIGRRPRSSSGDRTRGPAGPAGPTRPITSPIAIVAPTADIQAIPSPPGSSLEEAHPTRRTGPPSNAPGRCSRSAHLWPNRNAAPSRGRSATTTRSSPATRGKSKIATRNAGRSATRRNHRKRTAGVARCSVPACLRSIGRLRDA